MSGIGIDGSDQAGPGCDCCCATAAEGAEAETCGSWPQMAEAGTVPLDGVAAAGDPQMS
jgi:hypothetical protein